MRKESDAIDALKRIIFYCYPKAFFRKIHVSPIHNKGFPDCVVVCDGVTIFAEVKAYRKRRTPLQIVVADEIKQGGGNYIKVEGHKSNKHVITIYHNDKHFKLNVKDDNAPRRFAEFVEGIRKS